MPRRWTNGPGREPNHHVGLFAELNPRAAAAAATRRSGRMYPQPEPTMPTGTRSAAHGPTTRRTDPPANDPTGVGAFGSRKPNPPTTFSGSSSSLPAEGTPSRVRAREEADRG
jgi:hypothetical protein